MKKTGGPIKLLQTYLENGFMNFIRRPVKLLEQKVIRIRATKLIHARN